MDPGSHVEFQISTKNTNLVEDHLMNISGKSGSNLQRRFKCEKLTDDDGRKLSHDKTKAHMAYGQVS